MSTEDDEPSRRPKDAVMNRNVKKYYEMVSDDRKVILIDIVNHRQLSKECVGHIVRDYWD